MYSIYVDDKLFFDDSAVLDNLKLINPVLTLEEGKAGSLEFVLPPGNACYNDIDLMRSVIKVYKRSEEIWAGRAIMESSDFYKRRKLVCEGEFAYLNDTTQPPLEFNGVTTSAFLQGVLNQHNEKVPSNKQFFVGVRNMSGVVTCITNYEKTIDIISQKLLQELPGKLLLRKENGIRYIDMYDADDVINPDENTQVINFGSNLLDFTRSFDMTDMATVIVPLGAMLDDPPENSLKIYTDVSSVNGGSIYVYSDTIYTYGWIEKVVQWSDTSIPSVLLNNARNYLASGQFDKMVLEISAFDLNYIDPNVESIKLLDNVRVVSTPHGLNKVFKVSKLTIPLDNPENAVFTLSTEENQTFTKYMRDHR